jgi:preprotein translocase subunit YajC
MENVPMECALIALMPIVAAEEGKPQGMGPLGMLFPVFIMIFIFYFLLIRPQKKLQRDRQTMIDALQKHDQVLTRGGILGTIADIRPDREEVVVEIAKNTRIRVRRQAIEAVIPREAEAAKGDRERNR